jgi:hypothetical protein
MSLRRNTFGRASVDNHSDPTPDLSSWSRESWSDGVDPRRWLLLLLFSPMLILFVDGLFSGTELITPLNRGFLWWMRGLGVVDGIALSYLMATNPGYFERGGFRALLGLLAMPVFMAATFDALAWRAADSIAFGMSKAPYEAVQYPIKSVSRGRKGRRSTIDIDPFETGENSHIPIPSEQYRELLGADDGLCVTIRQRRAANGAVEILTNGSYTLHTPDPAIVSPC